MTNNRTLRRLNQKVPAKDRCQTPYYALVPLLKYLPPKARIWESASGEGYLVNHLRYHDYAVIAGDIQTGQNYFTYQPEYYDLQITNPPYSLKFSWLLRAYKLGKPFALLMPSDIIFTREASEIFHKYPMSMLSPSARIDYKMPNVGWNSNANFHTSWFTYKIGIPEGITYCGIDKYHREAPNRK